MKLPPKNTFYYSILTAVLFLPSVILAIPVGIGTGYDAVIQELGEPDGEIRLGGKQILTYGDARLTLRDKVVVEMSPEFDNLLVQRKENLKKIQAKRDANLVSFRGKWITNDKKKQIIEAETRERTRKARGSNDGIWHTDFMKALEIAQAENKKLLLNFTGSDWCGWCIKLEDEVFSQPEFQQYARQNYILIKLDFPKKKKLSPKLKEQNNALAKKFQVTGFPTIIVVTPSGKLHARSGYVKGGPNAFLRSIL